MDERKSFKRDFLSLLQSRILEAEALGRNVILVRHSCGIPVAGLWQ